MFSYVQQEKIKYLQISGYIDIVCILLYSYYLPLPDVVFKYEWPVPCLIYFLIVEFNEHYSLQAN